MININDVKKFLIENCINDNGDLDLSNLNLEDFKGNLILNNLVVKNNVYMKNSIVYGSLLQDNLSVHKYLGQNCFNVGNDLFQRNCYVFGEKYE